MIAFHDEDFFREAEKDLQDAKRAVAAELVEQLLDAFQLFRLWRGHERSRRETCYGPGISEMIS